jgi:F0F1-type ATP synthase membrane subunit b/b'
MYLLAFAETIQLFPDGTLFIHVALILLMIWILNRTLYRPLNRVIESRERSKGGRSTDAVDILKDVEAKESTYTREMLETRTKGYELIETEQRKAVAEREQKLQEAKAAVSEKFTAGRTELESQSAAAHAAISTDAQKIAESIAANILKA